MVRTTRQQIYIQKSVLAKWLTYAAFVLPFSFAFLVELLHLPGVVRFATDFLLICIGAIPVMRGKLRIRRPLLPLAVLVMVFALYTLLVYLFRYQSVLYYIWGFRNNFRFYFAFFAFASYFREEDGSWCLDFLDKLFWLNAALCLVQFLMGNGQDMIGGIFGVSKGCNAYLIIYLSVVIFKSLLSYMNGSEKTLSCFYKCAVALFISAIAELKFFFFMFIVALVLAAFLTSFSLRKVALFGTGAILLSATAALLGYFYSYFEGFLSARSLVQALTQKNYASDIDMGRFTAIPFISRRFLTDFSSRVFGMGLGNCDTSSVSVFNTPFSDAYVDLHYSIFSYAFMFLENGYLGLALYVLFFVLCFLAAGKRLKRKQGNRLHAQLAVILSAMCFVLIFYNSSLRTEAGYMIYFVLALPFMESGSPENRPTPISAEIYP